jgi:HicA-like toxin of HicAB toxin-antitoxin system
MAGAPFERSQEQDLFSIESSAVMTYPGDTARTVSVPCHSARDLKPGTLRAIIRQAHLTVEEFTDLL